MSVKKLYKDRENRWIFGVCAGIGNYVNIDAVVIRLLWIFATFFPPTVGVMFIIYIVLAIFLKKKPKHSNREEDNARAEMKTRFTEQLTALTTQIEMLDQTTHQMERFVTSDEFLLQRKIDEMNA
jgi:phage shock protein C